MIMHTPQRRDFLKTAGAAFTTSLFTGNVKGANDRLVGAVIGMGRMGMANLSFARKMENVSVKSVCDVYEPHLKQAVEATEGKARPVRDFREILGDKEVDFVCISTPDHWHAYMTVEACKAGKDVYVEKPICVTVEEGAQMVEAARKYNRVVQAGTMQRSGIHFQQAAEMVRRGDLGKVTVVHTWNYGNQSPEGIGNPADGDPPAELDWDMWLGPAPRRPFNKNRFGVDPKAFSHFRWFWDYAGGMMTDWGVHWLDIVQMAFDEAMPTAISASGGKMVLTDNRDTPDTIHVTYEYPGFIATYENRSGNAQSMFGKGGGILFHGARATLFVDRGGYKLVPEKDAPLAEVEVKRFNDSNTAHWENFMRCIKSRERPISDIETCQRSTTTCLLGNVALRSKLRIDWDSGKWTTAQADARKFLSRESRDPWKIRL
ncbi:MAG: Gfo/Idh/MocA family oxidoreductase [Bryobacteraceae bacterium]|nr:Gfo/Idh/MocA family oxidoreductase [Bryobacteraceae bacterium]